jgi:hypothetical protein
MEYRKKAAISFEDYLDFNRFHAKKRLIFTPIIFIIVMLAVIIAVGLIYVGSRWYAILYDPVMFLILFAGGLIVLIDNALLKSNARKIYDSSGQMRSESEITINSSGVSEASEFGSATIVWKDILREVETKEAFYLFFSGSNAFMVPKRLLEPGEADTIKALIKQNLSPSKYRFREKKEEI